MEQPYEVDTVIPLCRWENVGTKNLNNFLKVTQLVSNGPGIAQFSELRKKRQVS